jgi:rSAM/selenodomain-associated transferase 1
MLRSNGLLHKTVDNPVDKVDNSAKSNIFSHSGPIIGLFAKQPIAGQVKTRLTPPLTEQQACQLYSIALRETIERLVDVEFPLVLCFAGERSWFAENFPDVPLLEQRGDGLAERMANAVDDLFEGGAGSALLCGSDSPDLPIGLAAVALELLENTDIVTVPCGDGGYVMIGARRATTDVFYDVPWSTELVQQAFRQRCKQLDLSYRETSGWHDLDEVNDLRQLVKRSPESKTGRYVAAQLSELL